MSYEGLTLHLGVDFRNAGSENESWIELVQERV
jgi:hypothetical protein